MALKYNDEKPSKIEFHCKSLYMRKLKDRNDKTDGAERVKRFSGLKSDDRTLEMQTWKDHNSSITRQRYVPGGSKWEI